jgi:hypothetical protein
MRPYINQWCHLGTLRRLCCTCLPLWPWPWLLIPLKPRRHCPSENGRVSEWSREDGSWGYRPKKPSPAGAVLQVHTPRNPPELLFYSSFSHMVYPEPTDARTDSMRRWGLFVIGFSVIGFAISGLNLATFWVYILVHCYGQQGSTHLPPYLEFFVSVIGLSNVQVFASHSHLKIRFCIIR